MTEASKKKDAERKRRWTEQNAERVAATKRSWYLKNKTLTIQRATTRYRENVDAKKLYDKRYNALHLKRNNKRKCEYTKRRRETPFYKFKDALRHRIWCALIQNGYKRNSRTETILGATFEAVRNHIENQFKHGMNWDNYGDWHIDHKTPLAVAKTESELLPLFHYTNLQPLWKHENLSKGKRLAA